MIADWTVYGKMKYSFTRKCADEDTSETWEEQQDIDGDYTDKSDFTVRKTAVVGNELFSIYFRFTSGLSKFFNILDFLVTGVKNVRKLNHA